MSLFRTISNSRLGRSLSLPLMKPGDKVPIKETSPGQAARTASIASTIIHTSTSAARRSVDNAIRTANVPGVSERGMLTGLTGSRTTTDGAAEVAALSRQLSTLTGIPVALAGQDKPPGELAGALFQCLPATLARELKDRFGPSAKIIMPDEAKCAGKLAADLGNLSAQVRGLVAQGHIADAQVQIENFHRNADKQIGQAVSSVLGLDSDSRRGQRNQKNEARFMLGERLQALRPILKAELQRLVELTQAVPPPIGDPRPFPQLPPISAQATGGGPPEVTSPPAESPPQLPPKSPPTTDVPTRPQQAFIPGELADALKLLGQIDGSASDPVGRALFHCKNVQRPAEKWPGRAAAILAGRTPLDAANPAAKLLNKSFKVADELPGEFRKLANELGQKIDRKDSKGANDVLLKIDAKIDELVDMIHLLEDPKVHDLYRDGQSSCMTLAWRLEGLVHAVNEQLKPLAQVKAAIEAAKALVSPVNGQHDAQNTIGSQPRQTWAARGNPVVGQTTSSPVDQLGGPQGVARTAGPAEQASPAYWLGQIIDRLKAAPGLSDACRKVYLTCAEEGLKGASLTAYSKLSNTICHATFPSLQVKKEISSNGETWDGFVNAVGEDWLNDADASFQKAKKDYDKTKIAATLQQKAGAGKPVSQPGSGNAAAGNGKQVGGTRLP